MSRVDADVVVVGCGPVGVMLALRCAQRGLHVIALDKDTDVYPLPRAIGMDDEIQQLFETAGLGDALRRHSTPMLGAEFVNADGERVVGIDLPPGTLGPLGHPPMVAFDQPSVERCLRTAAIDAGVELRLGLDAHRVETMAEGVRIDLSGDPVTQALTCRWLVGCDGAKSTVRALRGIDLVDQGFDQTWLVVDTTLLDPDLSLPAVAQQRCDPARICTFVPGHGTRRRWEFRLRADECREQVLDPGFIAELLAPWGTGAQLQIDRAAVYRFHATLADRFRDGAVFLAGDAAHQMPPFNGQGMCTGMRDAENLAWKLVMVAAGQADDRLLDSYEAERRPHAAAQVDHSVDAGLLIEAIANDGAAALDSGYGQRRFPSLQHGLIDGDHPVVGRPLVEPTPRAALAPSRARGWTLLRIGAHADPVPDLWHQLSAEVIEVPIGAFRDLVEDGTTVVVRPDRYVAAVTADLGATTRRLSTRLGPPSTPQPEISTEETV